jgi:hypothetical protein
VEIHAAPADAQGQVMAIWFSGNRVVLCSCRRPCAFAQYLTIEDGRLSNKEKAALQSLHAAVKRDAAEGRAS